MASIPTVELLDFFDDLVRCETRLYNAVGESLRAEHAISTTQFECLRYLRDHPDCRVADIAATFAAGFGATSKLVDRLQDQGLVVRRANPADRRSALLSLTARGTRVVGAAEQTFASRLDELVSGALGPRQLQTGAAALRRLRNSLEASRLGLPTG